MANIFDIMEAVNGQLNIIERHYSSGDLIRSLPKIPTFLLVALNRAISNDPDTISNDVLESEDKCVSIDIATFVDTGDPTNPVYVATSENVVFPIVDKVPIMVNKLNKVTPGIGYVIIVPSSMFTEINIEYVSYLLKELYFKVLRLDNEMQFRADYGLIKYSETDKVIIPTYDITMMYVSLGFAFVNLRQWFVMVDTNSLIDSRLLVSSGYGGVELDDNQEHAIATALNKHAASLDALRDSVASGELLSDILYGNK